MLRMLASKDDRISYSQHIFCSCLSGCISKTLTSPFDVMKVRYQVGVHETFRALSHAVLRIKAEEGITAFWKGNTIACLRITPFSILQMTLFYRLRLMLADSTGRLTTQTAFIAGASSGLLATVALYPLDVVKTRFIVQKRKNIYKSVLGCIHSISKREGFLTLFRGLSTAVLGSVIFSGTAFVAYEFLDKMHNNEEASHLKYIVSGCIVSAFAQTLAFPFDTVRKKMQVFGKGNSPIMERLDVKCSSISKTVLHTTSKYGLNGLWRGNVINLMKIVPSTLIALLAYEVVKRRCLYVNGYTTGLLQEYHQSTIDQGLQVDEVDDFLEEIATLQEIQRIIESEYQDFDSNLQS